MSYSRESDVRVERAAALAVERSLLGVADLRVAEPRSDFGVDLLVYRERPLRAAAVQVKGHETGLKVWRKHASPELIVAYVLGAMTADAKIYVLRGDEAWRLPVTYQQAGGRASDYRPDLDTYRWARVPKVLTAVLARYEATEERWREMFEASFR